MVTGLKRSVERVVGLTPDEWMRRQIDGFHRQVFAAYLARHLEDVRRDQFRALIEGGDLLIKYTGPGQEHFDVMIRQLERFVGRDRLIQVIDEAVDPELIEFVVKNKRPDLYKEVIGSEDRYSEGKGCVNGEDSMYGRPGRTWFL